MCILISRIFIHFNNYALIITTRINILYINKISKTHQNIENLLKWHSLNQKDKQTLKNIAWFQIDYRLLFRNLSNYVHNSNMLNLNELSVTYGCITPTFGRALAYKGLNLLIFRNHNQSFTPYNALLINIYKIHFSLACLWKIVLRELLWNNSIV